MTSPATTPPLHVLRGILRHLKLSPAHSSPTATASSAPPPIQPQSQPHSKSHSRLQPHPLRRHILLQYQTHKSLLPHSPKAHSLRSLAHDYYRLTKDLKERARLYELDAGAEEKLSPRELSRRAAARAGLRLPRLEGEQE